jgi:hypothetical protein
LLLKDLIKHTWEEHPDYSGMKQALSMMKDAAREMNRSKQYQKSKRKIDSLFKKVYGDEEKVRKTLIADQGPRTLVFKRRSVILTSWT